MKGMTEDELREYWSTLTTSEKIDFLNELQSEDKLEQQYVKEADHDTTSSQSIYDAVWD